MKTFQHLVAALTFIALLVSCSSSSDTNGTTTTTVVPAQPTGLTGNIANNQVVLTWTDNATNETGFKIDRMTGTGTWTVALGTVANNIQTYTDASVTAGTSYTYRVYAYNEAENSLTYSNTVTFSIPTTVTDIDGNTYATVVICNQTWTKQNINVTKYKNGDVIPQVIDPIQWANLTTGAWCYYNNDSANGTTYGKLYNWYAVNDPRGLAPTGWHVPTDTEWTTLWDCLGGESVAGGKMKETGTTHWNSPNTSATNSSGFTGLPGGYRTNDGPFTNLGTNGYWWSSSAYDTTYAWYRDLFYYYGNAYRNYYNKRYGFSVRCLRD